MPQSDFKLTIKGPIGELRMSSQLRRLLCASEDVSTCQPLKDSSSFVMCCNLTWTTRAIVMEGKRVDMLFDPISSHTHQDNRVCRIWLEK